MKQSRHARFAPARRDVIEILIEVAKHDVTVTVNQRGSGRHRGLKLAFAPIVPSAPQVLGSRTRRTAAESLDFWLAPLLRCRTPTLTALSILLKAAFIEV